MKVKTIEHILHKRNQFRLVLCGHKAIEAGAVCLILMVHGNIFDLTLLHLAIAAKTGLLSVFPLIGFTFTRYVRFFSNRWSSSLLLGVFTFVADAVIHASHYPGEYTEAVLTGLGAFMFSLVISYTPMGKRIDGLVESYFNA